MRRSLLTIALWLVLVGGADAHHSATSRVHNIREIVLANDGDTVASCDHGVMDMPIIRVPMPVRYVDGQRVEHVAEFAHLIDDDPNGPYHDCRVLVKDQSWETWDLCVRLRHEFMHARKWRAPPGEEYVGPWGPDDSHSRDPLSPMYPFELQPWPPCDGAAT